MSGQVPPTKLASRAGSLHPPEDHHTHFLLYFVAETMRKSLCRASTASGPGSSFCSSLTTREQNFCSSSSWISLNEEQGISNLVSGDPATGAGNAALSRDRRPWGWLEEHPHGAEQPGCPVGERGHHPRILPPWDAAVVGSLPSPAGRSVGRPPRQRLQQTPSRRHHPSGFFVVPGAEELKPIDVRSQKEE